MKKQVFMVTLNSVWDDTGKKTKERYDILEAMGIDIAEPERDKYGSGTFMADRGLIADLVIAKIEFSIGSTSTINLEIGDDGYAGALDRIMEMVDKIEKVSTRESRAFNDACNVHMPGNGLLMFNETLLLEDTCTDTLQESLNKGWRIIVACPQPDQRRPDYILGRYNPDTQKEIVDSLGYRTSVGSAKRSGDI